MLEGKFYIPALKSDTVSVYRLSIDPSFFFHIRRYLVFAGFDGFAAAVFQG